MPIYEYYCDACETKFELLRPFSKADDPATCPVCHERRGRRLLSKFACFAKGEGGSAQAIGGGCAGCSASSCAGCKR